MACKFGNPFGTVCCFECEKECEYYFDGKHEKCINDEEVEVIEEGK